MSFNLIVVLGPTASGKTKIAVRLASEMNSEIISADSRQVYRGMDIGTGKDLKEYIFNNKAVPYHLIDIVEPIEEFSVFEYQKLFFRCFSEISNRGMIPIMVGGTGLYIESVLMSYEMVEVPENEDLRKKLKDLETTSLIEILIKHNPNIHNTTDLLDRKRLIRAIEIATYSRSQLKSDVPKLNIKPFIVGIRWDRAELRNRITNRLLDRLETGLIEEVQKLHESGISFEKLDFFGLEYRYIGLFLQRVISYEQMLDKLNTRIHQYAKRQETWFRRMERKGMKINWINRDDYGAIKKIVKENFKELLKD